jgi:hypothetical protein
MSLENTGTLLSNKTQLAATTNQKCDLLKTKLPVLIHYPPFLLLLRLGGTRHSNRFTRDLPIA